MDGDPGRDGIQRIGQQGSAGPPGQAGDESRPPLGRPPLIGPHLGGDVEEPWQRFLGDGVELAPSDEEGLAHDLAGSVWIRPPRRVRVDAPGVPVEHGFESCRSLAVQAPLPTRVRNGVSRGARIFQAGVPIGLLQDGPVTSAARRRFHREGRR